MATLATSVVVLMLLCPAVNSVAWQGVSADTVARSLSPEEARLVNADNTFGFKVFKEIVGRQKDKNVFVSPLSMAMALGMTYIGAGGLTAEAMKTTLEVGGLEPAEFSEAYRRLIPLVTELDDQVRFDIANSIWYRSGFEFRKEFLELNRRCFAAEVRGLDFGAPEAAGTINKWVSEKTNEKIGEIVSPPLDRGMVMLLMNAMYFKGTWTYEFDKNRTRDDTFVLADKSRRPCRMMVQSEEFDYLENEEVQAIDLPYGDGNFRMTVLLPKEESSVDALVTSLNEAWWEETLGGLRRSEVSLELPKFKMEYEITMNDVLTALGMGVAFEAGKADFSGMYGGPEPLSISEVKHKTFVQVDEEGTEAAAVTSVGIVMTSARPPLRMRVDHPFVFIIRDRHSRAILFMGKIVEPTWEEEAGHE